MKEVTAEGVSKDYSGFLPSILGHAGLHGLQSFSSLLLRYLVHNLPLGHLTLASSPVPGVLATTVFLLPGNYIPASGPLHTLLL